MVSRSARSSWGEPARSRRVPEPLREAVIGAALEEGVIKQAEVAEGPKERAHLAVVLHERACRAADDDGPIHESERAIIAAWQREAGKLSPDIDLPEPSGRLGAWLTSFELLSELAEHPARAESLTATERRHLVTYHAGLARRITEHERAAADLRKSVAAEATSELKDQIYDDAHESIHREVQASTEAKLRAAQAAARAQQSGLRVRDSRPSL